MLLSNCVTCKSKKSRFMKEQEAKGLLSTSVLKTYQFQYYLIFCFDICYQYKINEIINKLIFIGRK